MTATPTSSPCEQCIVNAACRKGCDKMKKYIEEAIIKFKPADGAIPDYKWLQYTCNIIRQYPDTGQSLVLAFGMVGEDHCVLRAVKHNDLRVTKIEGKEPYFSNDGN